MSNAAEILDNITDILKKQKDIAGKDYFTPEEAAHYCCVSPSQFRAKKDQYHILPFTFMGKLVYRKSDLQRIIEGEAQKQWQR